jgi:hypothetical protein
VGGSWESSSLDFFLKVAKRKGSPTFPFQGGGGCPGGVVFNEFLLELTIRKDDFIRLFLGGGGVWGEWL